MVRSVEEDEFARKMVQEKVESRTSKVCVIVLQTEGGYGDVGNCEEGQHV